MQVYTHPQSQESYYYEAANKHFTQPSITDYSKYLVGKD